ncbi:MAG: SCO family protein [Roseivirga sp.]|nr:SCO family protein [Roseivirga sp.]
MRTKYLTPLLLLLVVSCSKPGENQAQNSRVETLPFYKEATFTPDWLEPDSEELQDYHKIPAFNLINQLGDTVTEASLTGKIYVSDFFFTTCPGICPKMTTNMGLLQEEFLEDDDIMLLSHSVTPEIDNVIMLQNYAEAKGVKAEKWHLLTGDRKTIYDLGRKSYFVEEDQGVDKTEDEFLHTENFVLIDQNRHIRGIYNGLNKASVSQLIADIKTLKKEIL